MKSKLLMLSFLAILGLAITVEMVLADRDGGDRDRHGEGRGRDNDNDDDDALRGDNRVEQGFQISPVPINVAGRRRNLVGLGSYIVNAQGACADCHSCPTYEPGNSPYKNPETGRHNRNNFLAGGVHFGPFTSANLTPDVRGLPAGLTREEFIRTIRSGRDHEKPNEILQVMPWPIYRNMADRDLKAVYEYLSSIPHAEPGVCGGPGE